VGSQGCTSRERFTAERAADAEVANSSPPSAPKTPRHGAVVVLFSLPRLAEEQVLCVYLLERKRGGEGLQKSGFLNDNNNIALLVTERAVCPAPSAEVFGALGVLGGERLALGALGLGVLGGKRLALGTLRAGVLVAERLALGAVRAGGERLERPVSHSS
jgi:hypothetical protein